VDPQHSLTQLARELAVSPHHLSRIYFGLELRFDSDDFPREHKPSAVLR
jgi:hypothetical protein